MPFSDPDIPEHESERIHNITFAVSSGFYLLSLFSPAFCTTDHCRLSIEALLSGWLVMFTDAAGLIWIANPLLIISWIMLLKNKKTPLWLSLFASLLSISFLFTDTIIENEAGGRREITQLKPGYWLWIASCFSCFIGSIMIYFLRRRK